MSQGMPLYTLTDMTGREAGDTRTVVVGTFELNWRLLVVIAAAIPVGIIITAVGFLFAGEYAIVIFPIVVCAAVFLFYRRSTSNLRLHTYRTMMDKRSGKKVANQFYVCGHPVTTSMETFRKLQLSTAPYASGAPESVEPLVAMAPVSRADKRSGHGHLNTSSDTSDLPAAADIFPSQAPLASPSAPTPNVNRAPAGKSWGGAKKVGAS